MALTKDQIISLARTTADKYSLDQNIFLGLIEQESGFNTWASRYEPAFFAKYLKNAKGLSPTEQMARSTSYGLCQVMGATARELGFDTISMAALCDEATGLEYGAKKLAACFKSAKGVAVDALLKYNGGSNKDYPGQVIAKSAKYKS